MAFSSNAVIKSHNSDLCNNVLKKLGPDCLSETLRNEIAQVNGELTEITIQHFKYQFIVDCVKKFLDQNVSKKMKNKERDILSDPFYLTFVKQYAVNDGIQAFGITEDFIDKAIQRRQKTQEEKEELNKFVENEIHKFCIKIIEYAGYGQRYRRNQERAFQEAVKDLTTQFDDLTVAKLKLEIEENELNDQLSNYFENLTEGVSLLKNLISSHEQTLNFQSLLGKLFESRQKTLYSKINCFEYQILAATYHKKSVQALTKIREELADKEVVLNNNLNDTTSKLQTYAALGPHYEKLVDEYSELLRKVLHQKWTIESLKRRRSFGGCLSDKEDILNNSEQEEMNETSCSRLAEISSCSVQSETSDCSALLETADDLEVEDSVFISELVETEDLINFNETNDVSKLETNEDLINFNETKNETLKLEVGN